MDGTGRAESGIGAESNESSCQGLHQEQAKKRLDTLGTKYKFINFSEAPQQIKIWDAPFIRIQWQADLTPFLQKNENAFMLNNAEGFS